MDVTIKAHDIFVERRGKTVLDIPNLELFEYDKIGLIGANGAGKTTLLKLLSGEIAPDEGEVSRFGSISLIGQLDELDSETAIMPDESSKLGVGNTGQEEASGGELTRLKIAQAFSRQTSALFADEPTSHLDQQGINVLTSRLISYQGALVVVSHDRAFLDEVVDKIWELKDGKVIQYWGNYSDYREQKEAEEAQQARDHKAYLDEKARLQQIVQEKKKEAARVHSKAKSKKNTDKGGGRLSHQKSQGSKEKKLQVAAKSFEKKLAALEQIDPVQKKHRVTFKQSQALELRNPFPIVGEELTLQKGAKILLQGARFEVPLGATVAFVGENGCGKTTLFNAIRNNEEGITLASKAEIGYFSQLKKVIRTQDSVLEYLQKECDYSVTEIRSALAAVGITKDDVGKAVEVLSGGQIIKLSLIKTLLGRHNILLLDEPDNYLDIASIEALQQMILDYAGTVLLVTHDRTLIKETADLMYRFEDTKLILG